MIFSRFFMSVFYTNRVSDELTKFIKNKKITDVILTLLYLYIKFHINRDATHVRCTATLEVRTYGPPMAHSMALCNIPSFPCTNKFYK
jgi:hypothetical protein